MMVRGTRTPGAGLLLASALLGACGGGDDAKSPPSSPPADTSMAGAPTAGDSTDTPVTLNGCDAESYEDHSAESDERVIQIAANGLNFTPKCLLIGVGQGVRFEGSLSSHPLAPGNPDDPNAGSRDSPIVATSSGMSADFTFATAGTFPYFCELHAFGKGAGMAGAVLVR
jgi:plastocyanin